MFKAFNTIGVDQMEHPDGSLVTGQQLTMMIAGGPEGRDLAEQVSWCFAYMGVLVPDMNAAWPVPEAFEWSLRCLPLRVPHITDMRAHTRVRASCVCLHKL